MSKATQNRVAYGRNPGLIIVANDPVKAHRAPTQNDDYDIGQLWLYQDMNYVYIQSSYAAGLPIWTRLDGNVTPGGLTWSTYAAAGPLDLDANYGYILQNAGAIALNLPAASVTGDQIWINTDNSAVAGAGFVITCGAGQTISFGNRITTAGGTLSTIHPQTVQSGQLSISLMMVCTADNTSWNVYSINVTPELL